MFCHPDTGSLGHAALTTGPSYAPTTSSAASASVARSDPASFDGLASVAACIVLPPVAVLSVLPPPPLLEVSASLFERTPPPEAATSGPLSAPELAPQA